MWNYIEEINWTERSKISHGYESGKMYMLENFTPKRCNEIGEFVDERFTELSHRISKYETDHERVGGYGGDDSYSDMIHHVIGCGKDEFDLVMRDPSRLNNVEYVESFSYCLPTPSDFEALNADYHVKRAKESLMELARIVTQNDPCQSDTMIIKELMNRFLLIIAGDMDAAFSNYDYNNDYTRYYKFDANDRHALFANYINDAYSFLKFNA